jgi:hypothetical protein
MVPPCAPSFALAPGLTDPRLPPGQARLRRPGGSYVQASIASVHWLIPESFGYLHRMSDLEQEREELADDEAGSTAPGQPWAKTSSGDADNVTDEEEPADDD